MNTDDCFVLYVDHQGHPAPLSLSFHATASRRLASAVDRHPPSTITEVDSAFCPQCLAFHDSNTASTLGYCPKASCRLCPLCRSVAAVTFEETDSFYKCGLCSWSSRDCNLYTPIAVGNDGSITAEDLETAAEDLSNQWTERMSQKSQSAEYHYRQMLSTLEGMAKEQVKGQRSTFFLPSGVAPKPRSLDGPEAWNVQSLEDSMAARNSLVQQSILETVGGQELQFMSLESEQHLNESMEGKPAESILLQQTATTVHSLDDLLPLPVPLRPRKSRRCRAELAEGRPGILLKPKLNPLEGDSSLRTGHGQWWKKDSSAIQVLPRVRVSIHASDGIRHTFLFKVSNPTLGTIRVRLGPSNYAGEPLWDDNTQSTPKLERILVDPLTQKFVDARLFTDITNEIQATDLCQLEPAEDSFLELGKSSAEEPEDVSKWDAGDVLYDSKVSPDGPPSSLRIVGTNNSCAWFELVALEKKVQEGLNSAIPLSLQIEVGNGSWESSLVQPDGGEANDLVTFDIVVLWESFD